MLQAIHFGLEVLLWLTIAASAAKWFVLLRDQWGQGPASFLERLVPSRPRQRPFWTPFDVLIMLGALIVVRRLISGWMIAEGWITSTPVGEEAAPVTDGGLLASSAATSFTGLAAVAIVVMWLRLFDSDAFRKLGLTANAAELWLGLKACFLLLPPVLLISAGVDLLILYEHPVLKSLAQISTPGVFAAIFISTAVVTPLVEEMLFRVLLQGGLQGWADRESEDTTTWSPRSYWPIVVSSVIFALLHHGQGGAPIPLFFLSLGLGYLYRQTGCIAAPLVVHMVLNGMSLVVEMVNVQIPT